MSDLMADIIDLFAGLPRQGPGSDAATREAWKKLGGCRPDGRVLDLGCGTGAQTVALSRVHPGQIIAVDRSKVFVDLLNKRFTGRTARRVHGEVGDMADVGWLRGLFGDKQADVIWAEGAIYNLGYDRGLDYWRECLAPKGRICVSELSWLGDERPGEAAEYWAGAYPGMRSAQENLDAMQHAGFDIPEAPLLLPWESGWEDYHGQLAAALDAWEARDKGARAQSFIEATRHEIDICERFPGSFGYVFYFGQKLE